MKKRLFPIVFALTAMASSVVAQELSVQPIEAKTGEQATLTVDISEPAEATGLQFYLTLPAGMTVDENSCTVGDAAANHKLSVNPLASGDYLIVLYNMSLETFGDGTLLNIPVSISSDATPGDATLNTVCSAKSGTVWQELADVSSTISLTDVSAIDRVTIGKKYGARFNLNGQQITSPQKGINIIDGKKILSK